MSVSPHTVNSHSTGVADSGRWSTRRIAVYAMFVALAIVTSFIEVPIMPGVPYLKYDPSGIVCLIAGFAFGPSAAVIVSVLGFVPHLFIDPIGGTIAIICALTLSVPAALIYRKIHSRSGALLGIVVGAVITLAAALLCNWGTVPMYYGGNTQAFLAAIVPVLLPFNLIKLVIHGVVTFLIYKPISDLLGGNR